MIFDILCEIHPILNEIVLGVTCVQKEKGLVHGGWHCRMEEGWFGAMQPPNVEKHWLHLAKIKIWRYVSPSSLHACIESYEIRYYVDF